MGATAGVLDVAKEKPAGKPKRYGTMIRVSDAFAEALGDVTAIEKQSVAEFCDAVLLPIVRKRYRESLLKKVRKLEGGEE
jgi:hypothetical protein